jgi:TolB-like protein
VSGSKLTSFWQELLRRKVIRTGLSYSITAWLLLQVFDILLPAFGAPDWVLKVLIAVLIAGLPIALALAWSFEITADSASEFQGKRFGINGYLVIVLVVAVAYLLFDKFYAVPESEPGGEVRQAVASSDKSIAVLPFKNLSANQEDKYFSDGVMEAILNELSLIRDLKVISRTSVEGYRDTRKPITQIGRELDVAHVLEGSVQRAGDKVRVTAQLIAASNDKHLWSRNYDRALSDIFAIQSEIAEAISSNLELILTHSEQQMLINAPTSELRAYDLYLRGNHRSNVGLFSDRDADKVRESLRYCQQAVDLDPEFALAYVCVARSHLELGVSDFVALDEWLPPVRANLDKALELEPDAWQAYDVLARLSFSLGEYDAAWRHATKVLEINPNQPDYLASIGHLLIGDRNQMDRGIEMVLRSLELTPGSSPAADTERLVSTLMWLAPDLVVNMIGGDECTPDLGPASLQAISSYAQWQRNYPGYQRCQELALEKDDTPNNRINAGAANLFAGNYERARALYESVMGLEKGADQSFTKYPYVHRYAVTLIETGEKERGLALLNEYREVLEASIEAGRNLHGNKGTYYDLATIYSYLGDRSAAVDMLELASARQDEGAFFDYSWLVSDTLLDPLRDFPPFIELMQHPESRIDEIGETFARRLEEWQSQGRLLWLTTD